MNLSKKIENLKDLSSELSSQTNYLTSALLDDDNNSIDNLKREINKAVNELNNGIADLEKNVSNMNAQKKFWS
ncbi:MAG: hypothetical protein ACI4XM_01660 [Candidatus Coprovivens sp.]